MLQDSERKEIFDLVDDYRKAHARLADNYKNKRAHNVFERCSRRASHYLGIMQQSLYHAGQNLNDDDIKCFAVLVDSFEQMQRNRLLNELQKYAKFDVISFVGAYNRGTKLSFTKKKDVTELSDKELGRRIEKIRSARKNIKKHHRAMHNMAVCDMIHDEAYELAHAVVNGKLKNNSKTYLESVRKFLNAVIVNFADGDIMDSADKILDEKINEPIVAGTIVDNILDGPEQVKINNKPNIGDKPHIKQNVKSVFGKIGGWFKSVGQKISDKRQERQNAKELKAQQEREAAAEKAMLEQMAKAQTAQRKLDEAARKNVERGIRRDERSVCRAKRMAERRANVEQAAAVFGKAVSGAIDNISYGIGAAVDVVKEKHKIAQAKRETKKHNREIIRDAERVSGAHWKELKKQDKQKKRTSIQEQKEPNKNRNLFVRVAAGTAAAILLFGGILMCQNNKRTVQKPEPVKKEIKVKPVVQKQDVAPVTIDTAYATALVNYYNSALDIIGGAKKADVMQKINDQIKSGNIQTADYIGAERIAYAYFIYREYGFKIDVLDLAVNGNQKLTAAQQAELINVIMAAGERGTGVQQMAKQRVESRGGQMSSHSKFKNATKQQQRQHLKNLGVLKHVQHVK